MEQLQRLKVSQQSGGPAPNLFSNDDLDAIFGILDPTSQNYISFAQYKQGERGSRDLGDIYIYIYMCVFEGH